MQTQYQPLPVGASFEQFYERYKPLVRALVSRALYQAQRIDEKDDIEQIIWLKVWRAYPSLDQSKSQNGWVTVVTQHTLTDFFRQEQSKKQYYAPYDEDLVARTVFDQHCEETLLLIEAQTGYEQVYQNLKDKDRRVINLLLEGWKAGEIAQELGVDKYRAHYAIVRAQKPFRQRAGLPPKRAEKAKTGV